MSKTTKFKADILVETWFPGDTKPTVTTENKTVRVTDGKVEIFSLGEWVPGEIRKSKIVQTIRVGSVKIPGLS